MDAIVQGTPNFYRQQAGILHEAGRWIARYATRLAVITGQRSWSAVEPAFSTSLNAHGLDWELVRYRGECSDQEIARLDACVPPRTTAIVGVGGGKVLDVAKAVAAQRQLDFIAVPTLISTCSPVTPVSVIYTAEGLYQRSAVWPSNSRLTLVDTAVLAQSPVRYFISGMGDTLAKWYESRASAERLPKTVPVQAALQMAWLCREVTWAQAPSAIEDVRARRSSRSLADMIDTVFLVSGMVGGLGGQACRSALAHAVHNGLTMFPQTHAFYHGEKVAYGISVQLAVENQLEALRELLIFYRRCGLPQTLAELGIPWETLDDGCRHALAERIVADENVPNMPLTVEVAQCLAAFDTVERVAREANPRFS